MDVSPVIYFVIPCYNEEEALPETSKRLRAKLNGLFAKEIISRQSRVLFVDDGSKDNTWRMIQNLHKEESYFGGVKLAHNRGHQNALYAGLMEALKAGCDAAISMDADLQDDIDVIDQFIEKYQEGSQVVYGVRDNRDTDSAFKRGTAELFYRLMNALGAETVADHADYRLMGRSALSALSEYTEVNLFLRGIVPSIGFKTDIVYYKRGERIAGESKYPLKKMISFAVEGITSFSVKPLQMITGFGVFAVLISFVCLIYTLVSVFTGHAVAGWGSLMISIWLIGGTIIISLGIVGEYIGKIYMESKRRPRYIVEKVI
ncbi:glycosyltransferase family 2 protein [Bifidobacterium callimiconis]|uniref:glycosyltransferase family 2 protein n=1 Tax=Bifidobacterium callimiconis TaxID=2306973 RepID=UPI001BDC7F37|nr:glycosyltransferase family 2 protein [Bifidobacterium callimiconis]MBT1177887.1 glycosyltransferase family 2 protein [Bifidobacterium callimiconis]